MRNILATWRSSCFFQFSFRIICKLCFFHKNLFNFNINKSCFTLKSSRKILKTYENIIYRKLSFIGMKIISWNVNGIRAAEKKGYSGVLCYTKEKPISVQTGFGAHKKFDSEGRILVLEFKECILMNIYFPNGKASEERLKYKLEFYEEFLNFCKKHKKHLIVCGDVNTA